MSSGYIHVPADVLPHGEVMFPWSPKVAFTHRAARRPSATPRLASKVIFPIDLKTSPSYRETRLIPSKCLMFKPPVLQTIQKIGNHSLHFTDEETEA